MPTAEKIPKLLPHTSLITLRTPNKENNNDIM